MRRARPGEKDFEGASVATVQWRECTADLLGADFGLLQVFGRNVCPLACLAGLLYFPGPFGMLSEVAALQRYL